MAEARAGEVCRRPVADIAQRADRKKMENEMIEKKGK
jgi:hypothetical protein